MEGVWKNTVGIRPAGANLRLHPAKTGPLHFRLLSSQQQLNRVQNNEDALKESHVSSKH